MTYKKSEAKAKNTFLYVEMEGAEAESIRREIIEKSGMESYIDTFNISELLARTFIEEKVDYAVIEVGLGGRLDSTNVINNPILEIITTIGYDHMERLGNTLEEICKEKCGIIKKNSNVLIGHLNDSCKEVVRRISNENNATLYELDGYRDLGNRRFKFHDNEYEIISYASYQLHNASLSLYAFEILSKLDNFIIDYDKAKQALKSSIWHARFEIVKNNPRVILDGAHNIHGIEALCDSFDKLDGSKCVIFSALKRKEYHKMIAMINSHCDKLVITTFKNNEVISLDEFKNYNYDYDYKHAIDEAIKNFDNILVCGSLYFMSEVVLNYKFD